MTCGVPIYPTHFPKHSQERERRKKERQQARKADAPKKLPVRPASEDAEDGSGSTGQGSEKKKKIKKNSKKARISPNTDEPNSEWSASTQPPFKRFAQYGRNVAPQVLLIREQRMRESAGLQAAQPYEVFLKYLPHDATEEQVEGFFDGCGEILPPGPKVMRHPESGRVIRGFVTFATLAGMRAALARDLERMGQRSVSVTIATTKGTMQAEGTHTPAMFAECVRSIGVPHDPNGVFIDGTFGRGGHTRKILEALGPRGTLHAFDMDPEAILVGRQLEAEDGRFRIHHAPFSHMARVLSRDERYNQGKPEGGFVNGVLLDIGISSPQLDGTRGFRPEIDGPLDMRFDVASGETALQYLHRVDRHELATALEQYGGEHASVARRIADAVALAKLGNTLPARTADFARLVATAKGREYQAMHPAKMTFQALRIAVNREFEELYDGLGAAMQLLRPGGKVGIITWKHSECAIIVDYSRKNEIADPEAPLRVWYEEARRVRTTGDRTLRRVANEAGVVVEEAKRPSQEELRTNSRSRSAVLHILRRESGLRYAALEAASYAFLGWEREDGRTTQ